MSEIEKKCIGKASDKITEELRNLKSLIYHAKEVQDGMEALYRSLGDQHIDSNDYSISVSLDTNLSYLQKIFGGSYDLIIRPFKISSIERKAALLFMNGMTDTDAISEHIMRNLTVTGKTEVLKDTLTADFVNILTNNVLTTVSISEVSNFSNAVKRVLDGDSMLLIDGISSILVLATRKVETRAISRPEIEVEVQGAAESFIEDLKTNITLIRRRVKDPNLIVQKFTVGARSETNVVLAYYRGIANQELVYEMGKRLNSLRNDVGNPVNVPGLLADNPFSPFPTILYTERPDKLSIALLKGKVGVLIDGISFGLIAPVAFSDFFRTGEDYYQKTIPASIIRFLRYMAAFFSLTLPALYIAVTAFHPALIPTPLTLTLGLAREGVPFPVFLETLLMIFFLEILQEGGIRIPKALGPAISITGGLIIGDSAVRAGLISPALVIITAFTALATFCNTNYQISLTFRSLRIVLMVAGATFGMFGVMMGLLLIAAHLSQLESLGEPYVGILVPRNLGNAVNLKDSMFIFPPASRMERPRYLEPEDDINQSTRNDDNGQV